MLLGQDVSGFQGDINFDVLKNNTNFIIAKASEGTGFKDPKFSRNQSEARRVGLPLGYYHFARPDLGNSPDAEADWFIQSIGELRDGELLCLDYEANWTGDRVGWCKRFLDHLAGKLNDYKALIYMNQSTATGSDWSPVVSAGYGLWIAAYTFDPKNNNFKIGKWPFAAMQQWTDKQAVPGIPAVVDGDVFFGDKSSFKAYGYKSAPTQPPAQQTELDKLRDERDRNWNLYQAQLKISTDLQAKIDKAKQALG